MTRTVTVFVVISALLLLPRGASAWNNTGHMTIAYIAYTQLSKTQRDKVDELLSRHPDFYLENKYYG